MDRRRVTVDHTTQPLDQLISIDAFAHLLDISRRGFERLRSLDQIPPPNQLLGARRMPRWRPETVRRWLDQQSAAEPTE
jgi:hypothetical protein